jgi:hypothetical protein
VGAVLLAKVESKEFDAVVLYGWMDAALTRADDRALFGLSANRLPFLLVLKVKDIERRVENRGSSHASNGRPKTAASQMGSTTTAVP